MEFWNDGFKGIKPIFPTFQYSNIPLAFGLIIARNTKN